MFEFGSTAALAMLCRHGLVVSKGTNPFRLAPVPRPIPLQAEGVVVGAVETGGVLGSVGVVVGGVDGSVGVVVGGVDGSVGEVAGGVAGLGALSFTIV